MIILFLLFTISGCKETTNELSDEEIQIIRGEVLEAFNQSKENANAHNSDAIIQSFWNNDDLVYAMNGNLTKGRSNLYEDVKKVHSNPQNQGFSIKIEPTYVRVINPECALVSVAGDLIDFPTEEGSVNKNLTMTFLFEKIDGKWLITAGHESTPENLF